MECHNHIKPFIKKFCDSGAFYIYDVNTNQIVEVEKPVYDIVDEWDGISTQLKRENYNKEHDKTDKLKAIEEIKRAKEDYGLFSNFRPQKLFLGILTGEDVRKLHENGLRQLILEVSKDCTLNCAYCSTSGKYAKKKIKPHMDESITKKTIDFFCERLQNIDKPIITFYGGEPLLRFDLIKETVMYVKNTYSTQKIIFNLTTNATLLNREMLDFFIEHDIYIMISLDGPKDVNDRYRRFKNGKGTFKRIMKNLEFINKYNFNYYSNKVSISSVLSPPFDKIDKTIDFFSTNKIFSNLSNIRASMVNTKGTTFIEDFFLKEFYKDIQKVQKKFDTRIMQYILEGNLRKITIEKNSTFFILDNLAKRPIKKLHKFTYPRGVCHIGLRRVFVNTIGNFYICERSGGNYKIGCINKGFDYDKIASYYRKLEEVLSDCANCWAMSYCERCWVILGNLDEFTGEKKERFCSESKKNIENAFKIYTQLIRKKPDCMKVFGNFTTG